MPDSKRTGELGRSARFAGRIGVVLTRELFWYWPMGHIPTNEKRFMADEGRLVLEWTPPAGEWQIFVAIERELGGFKYFDCFVDPLVPGAVDEFLRLTHERYAATVGEHFGKTIPGIFTDEIEPPAWSPQIEGALDLDFSQLWPALRRDDHPRAAEVRFKLRECALKLFQERWEVPVAAWCRAHNLIWSAEKPTYRPAQFRAAHEPATDAGHRRLPAAPEPLTLDLRANARAAIAAAEHRRNRKRALRMFPFARLGRDAARSEMGVRLVGRAGCESLHASRVLRFDGGAAQARRRAFVLQRKPVLAALSVARRLCRALEFGAQFGPRESRASLWFIPRNRCGEAAKRRNSPRSRSTRYKMRCCRIISVFTSSSASASRSRAARGRVGNRARAL
jgi:hypothetical protein